MNESNRKKIEARLLEARLHLGVDPIPLLLDDRQRDRIDRHELSPSTGCQGPATGTASVVPGQGGIEQAHGKASGPRP